jgi:hypothetical protein
MKTTKRICQKPQIRIRQVTFTVRIMDASIHEYNATLNFRYLYNGSYKLAQWSRQSDPCSWKAIASQRLGKYCYRSKVRKRRSFLGNDWLHTFRGLHCKQVYGSKFGYYDNYDGFRHNATSKSKTEPFEAVSSFTAS